MNQSKTVCRLGATVLALTVAGCASTTVQPEQETFVTNLPLPSIVLVYKFAVASSEVTANQSLFNRVYDATQSTTTSERDAAIGQQVATSLADALVTQINDLGLVAMRADNQTDVSPTALVLTGQFIDINEGNRLRRLVIGFGAGASKVDTQVQLLAPSGGRFRTLLDFKTHAESGKMPGAAVTMGAGAAAQGAVTGGMVAANVAMGGVKAYKSEVDQLAGQTADKVAQFLSQFFAQEGWIPPDRVKKPLL